MTTPTTPAQASFRMPAEWEPHAATWIAWPHERDDWPGKFAAIPWVYTEIVQKLCPTERVRILVNDETAERKARQSLMKVLSDRDCVEFVRLPTNRVWTRDYGPLFITNAQSEKSVTDWRFNGWAKYDNWQLDDAVPAQLAASYNWRSWQPECR